MGSGVQYEIHSTLLSEVDTAVVDGNDGVYKVFVTSGTD